MPGVPPAAPPVLGVPPVGAWPPVSEVPLPAVALPVPAAVLPVPAALVVELPALGLLLPAVPTGPAPPADELVPALPGITGWPGSATPEHAQTRDRAASDTKRG